jgi:hypothetical protein
MERVQDNGIGQVVALVVDAAYQIPDLLGIRIS